MAQKLIMLICVMKMVVPVVVVVVVVVGVEVVEVEVVADGAVVGEEVVEVEVVAVGAVVVEVDRGGSLGWVLGLSLSRSWVFSYILSGGPLGMVSPRC